MKIDRSTPTPPVVPVAELRAAVAPRDRAAAPVAPAAPGRRSDSVEFSQAGRQLAAAAEGDPVARIAAVQERIRSDFYSASGVRRAVAQRILGSGDL
jgi:antitoxin (DNA-binding transcriptional repressor) of toxin-antitoxin stability system